MKEYTLVDLDFQPHRDLMLSGLLLKSNKHVVVLLAFDEDEKWFDGIIVCRATDFSRWRKWTPKEIEAVGPTGDMGIFNLGGITTFASVLRKLGKNRLISVSTHKEVESYYVATITSVTSGKVKLKLMDKKGEFVGVKTVKLDDVDDLDFGGAYVKGLAKKHLRKHPKSKIEG